MSRDDPVTVPPPAGEDDAYNATTKVGAMPAEVMARLRAEGLLPEADAEPVPHSPRPALTPRPAAPPASAPPTSAAPVSPADMGLPLLYSTAPPAYRQEADLNADLNAAGEPVARGIPSPPPKVGLLDDDYEFDSLDPDEPETTVAMEPPPSKKPQPLPQPLPQPPPQPPPQPLPSIRLETPASERKPDGSLTAGGFLGYPTTTTPSSPSPSLSSSHAPPPEMVETPIAFTSTPEQQVPATAHHQDDHHHAHHVAQADAPLAEVTREEEPALQRDVRAFGGVRLTKPQILALLVAAMVALVGLLFIMALVSQRR